MRIHDKRGTFKSSRRIIKPKMVILHHTAGWFRTSVTYLQKKGYGYHYIIERDGTVHNFVDPMRRCSHAYRRNTGTIGVCFVAGGRVGPVTEGQIRACIFLLEHLKSSYSSIQSVSGHKHQDPRSSRGRYNKIDPTFEGEPVNSVNWQVDDSFMGRIARESGLEFESMAHKLDPQYRPK